MWLRSFSLWMVALQMPPAARYARRARRFYNIGWRDDETEIMRCWDDAAPRRPQGVQAEHACLMMFDWFWIDFRRISGSLCAKISLRRRPGMNFRIILSLFWDHGGALERWLGAWCWKIDFRTRGTLRRTSILSSKVGLRASWKLPKASPKASQI